MPDSAEPSFWLTVAKFSRPIEVAGAVAAMITGIFWFFGLPAPVLYVSGGITFALFCVGVVGQVAVSGEQPFLALGRLWNESAPPPPRSALPAPGSPQISEDQTLTYNKEGMACVGTHPIEFEFTNGDIPVICNSKTRSFHGVIAEFVNSPHAKGWVPGIEFLEAQITFRNAERHFVHRVSECLWLDHENSYIQGLQSGKRARLIVAFSAFKKLFAG
jgi:hypothetical protein